MALHGHDIIGQAKTGTGKTLGFGIPLLQRVVATDEVAEVSEGTAPVVPGKPQALVVVPTRELCVQVAGDIEKAAARRAIRVLTVYGGRAYEPQVEAAEEAGSRSSSVRPGGCSTWPSKGCSTSATCAPSCSTRPTRCSTSASCRTSSRSSG